MICMIIQASITLVSVALIASVALAQTPPAPLRFEVASVRPVAAGFNAGMEDNPSWIAFRAGQAKSYCMVCISGLRYDSFGASLVALISDAYRIDARLLVVPDWVNQADIRYVIRALMPEGTRREQIPDMLKMLLEERFHLVVHRATVDQAAYALVVAKNGPKLKEPGDLDRSACEEWGDAGGPVGSGNQVCRSQQFEGDHTVNVMMMTNSAWGPMVSATSRGEFAETHGEYYKITTATLAKLLTSTLSTPAGGLGTGSLIQVTDRTGLAGDWHVVLDRSFGEGLALPTVSASLEKQGLRLERSTVPVEKLFVDKLDKVPTEN
jgi:uncharacterized protein (TIGR03435 family)